MHTAIFALLGEADFPEETADDASQVFSLILVSQKHVLIALSTLLYSKHHPNAALSKSHRAWAGLLGSIRNVPRDPNIYCQKMAAPSRKSLTHDDYTVAIICPLQIEMSAVRYMLDEEHGDLPPKEGDPNGYVLGTMNALNVAIGYLPHGDQGIGAAATVATHMKRSFPSVRLRLLIGTGGGVPSTVNDIRLGDVVVSMPDSTHGGVVQSNLGKETKDGFLRKGHLDKPPRERRNAVVKMESDHLATDNKIPSFVSSLQCRSTRLGEE